LINPHDFATIIDRDRLRKIAADLKGLNLPGDIAHETLRRTELGSGLISGDGQLVIDARGKGTVAVVHRERDEEGVVAIGGILGRTEQDCG
jgi:hypothetical protein